MERELRVADGWRRRIRDRRAAPGLVHDGRAHNYAFGLFIGPYKGVPEVSHGGATAGFGPSLLINPDQNVSVAVLCNASSATAPQDAHAVADLYLADRLKPSKLPASKHTLTRAEIDAATGLYRNRQTGVPLKLIHDTAGLKVESGTALVAVSASRFVAADGQTWEMDGHAGARFTDAFGTIDAYERVVPAKPTIEQLKELVGTYVSDDAETTITLAIDGGSLVLRRRPDTALTLTPIYQDAFNSQLGTVTLRRDRTGRPTELSVVQDRVWDLRFSKQAQPAARLAD